jgi:type II secretory pathway pseudopilin PulG
MAIGGDGHRQRSDGFGLIEVVLSLAILLVVLVSSSYLLDNVVQQAATNREKVAAAELAEQYLEKTSNATLATLESNISRDVLLTATPVVVGGVSYSVWSHLEWADTGNQPSLCSSGNPPQVIRATMTVKWTGGQQLGETSVINPPYGIVISGDGFLSIKILGSVAGKPPADTTNFINVGVNVAQIVGGVPQTPTTYNPDQYGCVFLQEPAGYTYKVTLASPTGGPTFISDQESLGPSQTTASALVAGLTTSLPAAFMFDEAGTVTLTPSAGAPLASNMPVSVSNGGSLQPQGINTVLPYPNSGTSAQLFPYTTPYSVWYGDCATVAGVTQEQPAGGSLASFTVTPNSSAAVTVTGLPILSIQATRAGGFAAGSQPNNATAAITDAGAPGDGCPAADKTGGETFGLAGFAPSPAGSTTVYADQTSILPQTYQVTIPYTPAGGSATNYQFTVQYTSSGWSVGGTTYAFGTTIPVTLP